MDEDQVRRTTESGRARRLFGLILLLVLLAFYYPWLSGDYAFYRGDVTYSFEPLSKFMGAAIRQGRLPLWNPYVACGVPQIAEIQPGIFYLFNLLFAFLPFSKALACFLVVHQWVAGMGGFLLIETIEWGALPAAVTGIVFALNGYMFSLENIYPLMATAAWMPLTLYLVCRLIQRYRRLPEVLSLALVVALLITAGRPEVYGPGILAILGWPAIEIVMRLRRGNNFKEAILPCSLIYMAVMVGALIAMPSILPPMEWIPLSMRSAGMSPDEVLSLSANWYDFLCLLMPQPLGDFHTLGNDFFEVAEFLPGITPIISSALIGPFVVLLIVIGATDKSWTSRWILVSLLAIILIGAAGRYVPGMAYLVKVLPGLALFRYPIKALIFAVWVSGVLAAAGLRAIVDRAETKTMQTWSLILISIIFGFGCLLLIITQLNLLPIHSLTAKSGITESVFAEAQRRIGFSLIECATIMLCGGSIAVAYRRKKISARILALSSLVLVALPLLFCAWMYSRHYTEAQYFRRPSFARDRLAELIGSTACDANSPRIAELYPSVLVPPPWYHPPGNQQFSYADLEQYARQLLDPNTNMDFQVPSIFGYELGVTRDYSILFHKVKFMSAAFAGKERSDLPLARFCRMTAAKYVLCQEFVSPGHNVQQLDPQYFDSLFENKLLNLRIYRVRDCLPRAYLMGSWRWRDSSKEVLDELGSAIQVDFDVSRCAYLQRPANGGKSVLELPESANGSRGLVETVQLQEDTPEHQTMHVHAEVPAVLIVADQFYPGWMAKVDGNPVDIFKANGFQRGVLVPPGPHEVKFDYEPVSLANGLRLSAVGLGLWLAGLLFYFYQRVDKRSLFGPARIS